MAKPEQVRVGPSLSSAVHLAAKYESIERGVSISVLLAEIIEARANGRRLKPPTNTAEPSTDEMEKELIRPTIFLDSKTYNAVEKLAAEAERRLPSFLAEWISAYFERRKVAA